MLILRIFLLYLLSAKRKLCLSVMSILLIPSFNSLANNINVNYDWYHYQGSSEASEPSRDCGPTCVSMAIHFVKNIHVPIRDIRSYLEHEGGTNWIDVAKCLSHWDISYETLREQKQEIINAVNNRNHILILGVSMRSLSEGLDINGESDDPELFYNRYNSYSGNHWIIVKGISDDKQWAIVYDPNVFGTYPYPSYWYSNGKPKGKDRYYSLAELDKALMCLIEVKGGVGDIISGKFFPDDNVLVSDNMKLTLYARSGFGNNVIAILPQGTIGCIIPDERNGRYADGYHWWRCRFGYYEGWCTENQLERILLAKASSIDVYGTVRNKIDKTAITDELEISVFEESRRITIPTSTEKGRSGEYFAHITSTDNSIAVIEGYAIRVIARKDGYIVGTKTHILTADDIAKGEVIIDINLAGTLVPSNLDVNKDGSVDIFDLIQTGRNFDEVGIGVLGDIDSNERVDMSDLFTIAKYIYKDISDLSIDNPKFLKRVYDALIKDYDPTTNMEVLLKRLQKLLKPSLTELFQNYPNPCNPGTWIPFILADQDDVTIIIYDLSGRLVRRLRLGNLPAGRYTVMNRAVYWDGCNELGERVTSGIYLYTLQAGESCRTKRMVVLR